MNLIKPQTFFEKLDYVELFKKSLRFYFVRDPELGSWVKGIYCWEGVMPDSSILYSREDAYVVLETNQPEQFLTPEELFEKLKGILAQRQPDELPRDVQRFTSLEDQTRYLMDTSCELDVGSDQYLQWYVVRLEK